MRTTPWSLVPILCISCFLSGSLNGQPYNVYWDLSNGRETPYRPSENYARLVQALGSGFQFTEGVEPLDSVDLELADVLVIAAVSTAFSHYSPEELAAIERYVERGGSLLILSDGAGTSGFPKVKEVAAQFGVTLSSDFPGTTVRSDRLDDHPIVEGLEEIRFQLGSTFQPGPFAVHAWDFAHPMVGSGSHGLGVVVIIGDSDVFSSTRNFALFGVSDNRLFAQRVFEYLASRESPYHCLDSSVTGMFVDCNQNTINDECDLVAGISADRNENGILDDCEDLPPPVTDCNRNGLEDAADIESGRSKDSDSDGVPDECALSGGSVRLPMVSDPASVIAADFDRDGRMDLAAAGPESASVSILLSRGDGAFERLRAFSGDAPVDLVAADLTGDESLDLAVIAECCGDSTGELRVLRGKGDGTFEMVSSTEIGPTPRAIAAADLNEDGVEDVAVAEFDGLRAFLTGPDAELQPTASFSLEQDALAIFAVDIDRDGHIDLVRSDAPSLEAQLSLFLGRGDGTFIEGRRIRSGVYGTVVADVNGDAVPDLIKQYEDRFSVLDGAGSGTFHPERRFTTGHEARTLVSSDVNGDGILDVVTAGERLMSVYLGTGNGGFVAAREYVGLINTQDMAVADLDGNGASDIVIAGERPGAITVVSGVGDGSFHFPTSVAAGEEANSLAAGDLNGDNRVDMIVGNLRSDDVSILLADDVGGFHRSGMVPVGSDPRSVAIADFDRNGRPDIAVATRARRVAFFFGKADGSFEPGQTVDVGPFPSSLVTSDLDVDGDLDVVVANADSGTQALSVLLSHGDGTFEEERRVDIGVATAAVEIGDLSGDGFEDLVVAAFRPPSPGVSVVLGNGDATFRPPTFYPTGEFPSGLDLGDIDEDGDLDIVTANSVLGTASILLGDGNGGFSAGESPRLSIKPQVLRLVDFDGDETLDILCGDDLGPISVSLGRGDGTFLAPRRLDGGTGPQAFLATDLNGDGRIDIASTHNGDFVSLLLSRTPFLDCDGNGASDAGELQPSTDCNANGILDRCEIASGAAMDTNQDGILDSCETADSFLRGDSNGDGRVNVTDPVVTILAVFYEGPADCMSAADADDSGRVNVMDAIVTLRYLFQNGPAIPDPGVNDCGVDPTDDELTCDSFTACPGDG